MHFAENHLRLWKIIGLRCKEVCYGSYYRSKCQENGKRGNLFSFPDKTIKMEYGISLYIVHTVKKEGYIERYTQTIK